MLEYMLNNARNNNVENNCFYHLSYLNFSVNCITTLADIQYCTNLQELYIRKNQIQDLNEICWLRSLTKLKNLWLEENPCAQGGEM